MKRRRVQYCEDCGEPILGPNPPLYQCDTCREVCEILAEGDFPLYDGEDDEEGDTDGLGSPPEEPEEQNGKRNSV